MSAERDAPLVNEAGYRRALREMCETAGLLLTDEEVRKECLELSIYPHPAANVAAAQLAVDFVLRPPREGQTIGAARHRRLDALKRAVRHLTGIDEVLTAARLYEAFLLGEATVSPDAIPGRKPPEAPSDG